MSSQTNTKQAKARLNKQATESAENMSAMKQFVIGQFNKPITFKGLNQPITIKVVITYVRAHACFCVLAPNCQ